MARPRAAVSVALCLYVALPAVPASAAPRVSFLAPVDGARVAGPQVQVRLAVSDLRLVDAGLPVAAGEGHAHLFVDREPVDVGEPIPTDQPNVVHLGKAPYDSRVLPLGNGSHTIHAQLADSSHVAMAGPTPKVTVRVATPAPRVEFVAPTAGTVATGVDVWLAIANLGTVDAGIPVAPGEGHAHVFVDRSPVEPGEPIPTDQPNIVHLGKAPYDARSLALPEGNHILWAQLADSSHVAIDTPTPSVKFTVAKGFRAKGTVEPACAEVATGNSDARVVFPVEGGLAQGSITSRCSFKTEGGACSWLSTSTRRLLGTFDASSRALTASVYGATERTLEAGDAGRCGLGGVVREPATTVNGSLAGETLEGTMGLARLRLRSAPDVTLEVPTVPESLATDEASARPAAGSDDGVPWTAVGVVGALGVLALSLALLAVRRRAAPEVPAPVPRARPAPAARAPAGRAGSAPAKSTPVRAPAAEARPAAGGASGARPRPKCPECGEARRAGAQFCFACGHRY